jgi:hypothetical protein
MSETEFSLVNESDLRSVIRAAGEGHKAPVVVPLYPLVTLKSPANVEYSCSHELMLSDTNCYSVILISYLDNYVRWLLDDWNWKNNGRYKNILQLL